MDINPLINIHHQHGFVSDFKTIKFDVEMCNYLLGKNELTEEENKHLFQSLYLWLIIDASLITKKYGYGSCDIRLSQSLKYIGVLFEKIKEKIIPTISKENINKYGISLLENINCGLNDDEENKANILLLKFSLDNSLIDIGKTNNTKLKI